MYRCYCPEHCLLKGGNDSDGRPLGFPFRSEYQLQTHTLRVQRERRDREVLSARTVQQAQAREAEAASALLFVTTLLDDPSIHDSTHSNRAPPNSASSYDSSFQAIVAGV